MGEFPPRLSAPLLLGEFGVVAVFVAVGIPITPFLSGFVVFPVFVATFGVIRGTLFLAMCVFVWDTKPTGSFGMSLEVAAKTGNSGIFSQLKRVWEFPVSAAIIRRNL